MQSDAELRKKLLYEYQVVHVDVGRFDKNKELAARLGAEFKSIPFLSILDGDGKGVVHQNTEPFETKVDGKDGHDAGKLLAWLTEHQATPVAAAAVLGAGLGAARRADKLVFLHFGAPWCGWCHRLEDWMARPEVAALLGKAFVDVKVDIDRMDGAKAVYEARLQKAGHAAGGIPWFVFLDGQGEQLAESNGEKGNIGFPYQPDEIAHFVAMLRQAKARLTDADIAFLEKSLEDNRIATEAANAKR
jgi:thiol-disulfide isomerase/thioredoxin